MATTFNHLDTLRMIYKFDMYKTPIGFSSKIEETNWERLEVNGHVKRCSHHSLALVSDFYIYLSGQFIIQTDRRANQETCTMSIILLYFQIVASRMIVKVQLTSKEPSWRHSICLWVRSRDLFMKWIYCSLSYKLGACETKRGNIHLREIAGGYIVGWFPINSWPIFSTSAPELNFTGC